TNTRSLHDALPICRHRRQKRWAMIRASGNSSSSSLSRRHRPARAGGFRVGKGGGYGQLDLRTGIESIKDSQLAPHKFGAFLHAGQAEVSGPRAFSKNLLIKALSVVHDPQPD